MPLLPTACAGPPAYQYNGHLQTIIPGLVRTVTGVAYERERLTLSDDDFVDLDWIIGGNGPLVNGAGDGIIVTPHFAKVPR